jgi:hypothetical protein
MIEVKRVELDMREQVTPSPAVDPMNSIHRIKSKKPLPIFRKAAFVSGKVRASLGVKP